ncbi:hypothetical protein EI555_010282, partial [Monodon monoceros]
FLYFSYRDSISGKGVKERLTIRSTAETKWDLGETCLFLVYLVLIKKNQTEKKPMLHGRHMIQEDSFRFRELQGYYGFRELGKHSFMKFYAPSRMHSISSRYNLRKQLNSMRKAIEHGIFRMKKTLKHGLYQSMQIKVGIDYDKEEQILKERTFYNSLMQDTRTRTTMAPSFNPKRQGRRREHYPPVESPQEDIKGRRKKERITIKYTLWDTGKQEDQEKRCMAIRIHFLGVLLTIKDQEVKDGIQEEKVYFQVFIPNSSPKLELLTSTNHEGSYFKARKFPIDCPYSRLAFWFPQIYNLTALLHSKVSSSKLELPMAKYFLVILNGYGDLKANINGNFYLQRNCQGKRLSQIGYIIKDGYIELEICQFLLTGQEKNSLDGFESQTLAIDDDIALMAYGPDSRVSEMDINVAVYNKYCEQNLDRFESVILGTLQLELSELEAALATERQRHRGGSEHMRKTERYIVKNQVKNENIYINLTKAKHIPNTLELGTT